MPGACGLPAPHLSQRPFTLTGNSGQPPTTALTRGRRDPACRPSTGLSSRLGPLNPSEGQSHPQVHAGAARPPRALERCEPLAAVCWRLLPSLTRQQHLRPKASGAPLRSLEAALSGRGRAWGGGGGRRPGRISQAGTQVGLSLPSLGGATKVPLHARTVCAYVHSCTPCTPMCTPTHSHSALTPLHNQNSWPQPLPGIDRLATTGQRRPRVPFVMTQVGVCNSTS